MAAESQAAVPYRLLGGAPDCARPRAGVASEVFGGWPGLLPVPRLYIRRYVKAKPKAGVAAGRGADRGLYRSPRPGGWWQPPRRSLGMGSSRAIGWGKLQRWVGGRARSGAEGGGGGWRNSNAFWGGCGRTRHRSGGRAGGWLVWPESPSAVSCKRSLWLPTLGSVRRREGGGRLSGWAGWVVSSSCHGGLGRLQTVPAGGRRGWACVGAERHGLEPRAGEIEVL